MIIISHIQIVIKLKKENLYVIGTLAKKAGQYNYDNTFNLKPKRHELQHQICLSIY